MALTNPYKGERLAGHVGNPFPKVETSLLSLDSDDFHSDKDV